MDEASAGQRAATALASDATQPHETVSSNSNMATDVSSAGSYESTHVHAVYDAIAPHFSATRHKPWPLVSSFLMSQKPGSIGVDIGCGNGKYLDVNPSLHILGSDRSSALVSLAQTERGGEVAVADGLDLPYRLGAFDFAISVAVIHHFSTPIRRQQAISTLLACLRQPLSEAAAAEKVGDETDAKAMIFVWALEQASSRRGWDQESAQDTLVPWVMRAKGKPDETFQRYYHLYKEGELEEDVRAAGGQVLESGYERDNWWVICKRKE